MFRHNEISYPLKQHKPQCPNETPDSSCAGQSLFSCAAALSIQRRLGFLSLVASRTIRSLRQNRRGLIFSQWIPPRSLPR